MVWLAAALAVLLTACTTRIVQVDPVPGDRSRIDHTLLLQPGQPQYQLDDLALFVMPMELESPPPEFPAAYTQGDLAPLVVCAEVWLDANGDVTRAAPLHQEPDCPARTDARTAAFEQAVVAKLRRWMWGSARICRFPERLREQHDRGDCTGNEVEIVAVPVRLAYAFTFERSKGHATVRSARR